ncbi:coatomer protein [Lentinula raphanica]|nr:coatomer protein [Lentinula raphanica]
MWFTCRAPCLYPSASELRTSLEKGSDDIKLHLHLYWEVCTKYDQNGKLKQDTVSVLCIHSYGRRNAVFALFSIYCEFELLIPDASELMNTFLAAETDSTCKLGLQMSVIEDVRLDCKSDLTPRARFFRLIFDLLIVSSHANPAAVKGLRSSDIDVRRKAMNIVLMNIVLMNIVLSMTSSRNVEEVVQFLEKQLLRTQQKAAEFDKASEYRQLLILFIHVTAIKFSEVAASIVLALMEFLGDSVGASSNSKAVTTSTALDVFAFTREVVDKFPRLRPGLSDRLVATLNDIRSGKVFRGVLWILGEFVDSQDSYSSTKAAEAIKQCIEGIRTCLGDIPIYVDSAQEETDLDVVTIHKEAGGGKPKAVADGTYATETANNATTSSESQIGKARPPLRTLILGGDFFTGTVLAVTLTKLVLRFEVLCPQQTITNALRAQAMLIMTSILRVGHAKSSPAPGAPTVERIMNCIQTLSDLTGQTKVDTDDDEAIVEEIFLRDTKKAFKTMIGAQEKRAAEKCAAESAHKGSTVQFSKKAVEQDLDDYDEDLGRATGAADIREDCISNLSRTSQLTGFSDPIYVKMHSFDIMLDVLLVNQTANTLQNLCLDFATLATIKVSSTETGVIFGSILWEGPNMSEACVILNDIHIDIMDYMKPAYCNEAQFHSMWTEFEWENRVNVHSTVSVTGHIRIRSKTQGIALSLGDRITMAQKDNKPSAA